MDLIELPDGKDWLYRPVLENLCRYESLLDGTLGLHDLAELNEALDAKYENERRINEAMRDK